MGWKIVEIDTDDHVSLYLNNLLIRRDSKKLLININDIDMLLLSNYKTNLSVQLINALTSANAIIITFSVKNEPASYIYAVEGNHMSLKVLEAQINWNNQFKGALWKDIIRNKITNQFMGLKHFGLKAVDEEYFLEIIANIKEFDITNREGHFAKVYWHALFGEQFIRDQKANTSVMINSMLNYGYALLRAMVIKSIVKKGLDPRIAVFHKSFSNFYALASDLMEPFRPLIDQIVFNAKDEPMFTVTMREQMIESLTGKVTINGKEEYLNNAIDKCVDGVVAQKEWVWVDIWKSS